jgi:hypothetical protein
MSLNAVQINFTIMKETHTPLLQITLKISDIKILLFETTQRVEELQDPLPIDSYEFRFDLKTETSEPEKFFTNLLYITLFEKQSEIVKIELAKLHTLTTFKIINYSEVIKKKKDGIIVPNQLISLTAGIAISTARGILTLNLKDTKISNAIIPIINPQMFIPVKQEK